jgi:hypothetical protein
MPEAGGKQPSYICRDVSRIDAAHSTPCSKSQYLRNHILSQPSQPWRIQYPQFESHCPRGYLSMFNRGRILLSRGFPAWLIRPLETTVGARPGEGLFILGRWTRDMTMEVEGIQGNTIASLGTTQSEFDICVVRNLS